MPSEPAPPRPQFDAPRVLRVLGEHDVRYVLIGAVGMQALGSTMTTQDVDVCYEASQTNVRALLRALGQLNAVRVDDADRPMPGGVDARTMQFGDHFLFMTEAGRVDCLRSPSGTAGYDDLVRTAGRYVVGGATVLIPSVEDFVRMKRAAGRPKDRLHLELLGALRDEIDGEPAIPFNPSDLPEENRQ
jgi:hypothetical protein